VVAPGAPARTRDAVLRVLDDVLDPEVPVLSVVELGIVRDVEIIGDAVTVVVTPTYSGCPAIKVIEDDILAALRAHGHGDARVRTSFAPAWTTDWIGDEAKAKLRAYGIAPPGPAEDDGGLVQLLRRRTVEPTPCPYCGSARTTLRSEFGSTACKAMHYCDDCRQPFEGFKAI
jgi:ring-1,2-phenylacetyl-CoA epoxidase subunit PaaD